MNRLQVRLGPSPTPAALPGGLTQPHPLEVAPALVVRHRNLTLNDVGVIRCRDTVTELHADNLRRDIADAAQRNALVLVDLTQTRRVDAVALSVFYSGARDCQAVDSALGVVGAHAMVAHAMRFTGLWRLVPMFDSVEAALQAVS